MWGNTTHRDACIRAFERGAFHSSYCFFGEDGVGKKTTALEIAAYIETGDILKKNLVDVFVFTPNEKGTFGIDEARRVKEFCSQTPLISKRRMAIVCPEVGITDQAQSALLKLLEEPPEHACICIIVKNKDILIPPLLSRLHSLYFPRYSTDDISRFLVEVRGLSNSQAKNIATQAMGSIGRAIELCGEDNTPEEEIIPYIQTRIIQKFFSNPRQYSSSIWKLLKKEFELHEYTLNGPLQKRFIQQVEHEV